MPSTTGKQRRRVSILRSQIRSEEAPILKKGSVVQRCQLWWISLISVAIYTCNWWWIGYLPLQSSFQRLISTTSWYGWDHHQKKIKSFTFRLYPLRVQTHTHTSVATEYQPESDFGGTRGRGTGLVLTCTATTDSTSTEILLNSSKQPHAPVWARPL